LSMFVYSIYTLYYSLYSLILEFTNIGVYGEDIFWRFLIEPVYENGEVMSDD